MTIKLSDKPKKNIMIASILLILTVALYNWFVRPHEKYLMAAQKYEATLESLDKKSKIINSELVLSRKKLDSLDNKFEQQKQSFFNISEIKDFLSGIQSTAEKSGCMVENLKLLPSREVSLKTDSAIEIYQYQANLSILGGYGNIVKCLNTIQNRPQKVWVESLNLDTKNPESGYLSCDVTFSIYTLKVKENIKNVANTQK